MQFVLIRVVAVLIPITKMLQQLTCDVNNQSITIITNDNVAKFDELYSYTHIVVYIVNILRKYGSFYQEYPCAYMLLLTLMCTW